MLDIELIRNETEKVKEGVRKKGYDPELVDEALKLDEKWREQLQLVEDLRRERNELAKQRSRESVSRGQEVKQELKKLEPELKALADKYELALQEIPNLPLKDVPVGKDESENVEVKKVGEPPEFSFKPKDHLELGEALDILDFESGSKVTGSGYYYLKNDGVLLELALVRYGIDFLSKKGFTPFITPDLARERYYVGTGYLPRGPEAQTYTITDSDLGLIATAEVTLVGVHADEVLEEKELPKRYSGYSHCFRVEAGSYGKYSKGLYRVHQFTKVEMFVYCLPEESPKTHEELLALEEEFWQSLGIPYRVVEMCTGDLGAQAAKKYDLEAWMPARSAGGPGRGDYGEVTSTSNTTDYQARRLNIRYRKGNEMEYVHTLNGTLVATPRAIISILENFQQKDGSVAVPEALRPYMGKEKIAP